MPDKIAEILAAYIRSEKTGNVTAIYFAAPPTEMELILRVRKYLRREGIKVYTAREMIGFLDKYYGKCSQVRELHNLFLKSSLIFPVSGEQVRSAESHRARDLFEVENFSPSVGK